MRTSTRRPAVLAATAFAALGLTLTACGGGDGVKDEGAASASQSTGTGTGTGSGSGSGKEDAADGGEDTKGGAGTDAAGADIAGSDTAGSAAQTGAKKKPGTKAPVCAADDVKISAAKQDGAPTTHITLTATNVSGHACTLLQYPLIAFGDIQTAKDVPAVAKSKPSTPVVLNAGARPTRPCGSTTAASTRRIAPSPLST
ncbi:DUF4232 domain-containing protein [Streptomyces rectiviolaceus]|uniref:DUF4232 domain-containing protein n=1 Tax=Streptomyces rectiviolaceus TaxID=332591 RepID=UPI0036252949